MTQSLHACVAFTQLYPEIIQEWTRLSNYIVVLSVKDESDLIKLSTKLSCENINFSSFTEPDINNQVTAICIEPCDRSRRICSNFPLALKEFNSGINKHTEMEST